MPYNSPNGLIAMSVILAMFSSTCVAARFFMRYRNKTPLATDDWLILFAVVCGNGLAAMEIYGAAVSALGVPLDATIEDPNATDARLNTTKHIELSFLVLGVLNLGLIKLSISFLVRRIFIVYTKFRILMSIWIVILVLWTVAFILAVLLECGSHLLALFETPQSYIDYCGSAIPSGYALVGSDIATDLITLMLPIPMIFRLQTTFSRKLLILGNFSIGLLSLGAGIGKAYIYITATLGLYTEDAIITLTAISVWNFVEIQAGIVAACGPALRPFFSAVSSSAGLTKLLYSIKRSMGSSSHSQTNTALQALPKSNVGTQVSTSNETLNKPRTETESLHKAQDQDDLESRRSAVSGTENV